MTILRVYDPPECDERGVPLNWERCRCQHETSYGTLAEVFRQSDRTCPDCGNHGSLKAAALAGRLVVSGNTHEARRAIDGKGPVRCEDCGHPMSDGTWEPGPNEDEHPGLAASNAAARAVGPLNMRAAESYERYGYGVHYSPCDEGCRHGGPVRYQNRWADPPTWHEADLGDGQRQGEGHTRQASWRPVDVRTLGWPHDLRPEKLAVLCLRCWADRPTPPKIAKPGKREQ